MSWITVDDAARSRRVSQRRIWQMIREKKLFSRKAPDHKVYVWREDEEPEEERFLLPERVDVPIVSQYRLTSEIMDKVAAMMSSIQSTENIVSKENELAFRMGIHPSTLQHYKSQLRKIYDLPPEVPISVLASHDQIRQVLEYVITPKRRRDVGELRSARGMIVTGLKVGVLPVEKFLLALFTWEGHNAVSCYRALVHECRKGNVRWKANWKPVPEKRLPAEGTTRAWLFGQERSNIAVRRSRMSKAKWEAKEQMYATSNPEEYRVGGRLMGDHTELDTLVYRNDGKVAPLWLTAWIDYRSTVLRGYELAYRPNSSTIALAFKRAVTGSQLQVCVGPDTFRPAPLVDVPDQVTVDNGKDYRSKYTRQILGTVDFSDEARQLIQRISSIHYTMKHHPQSKAQQERFFGVIQQITKYLPGYKGAKYQDKPDELKEQLKKGELLTEDQFRALFARVIDAYNNRPKRTLGHMSPMEYALTHQVMQRHVDERVLDFLMMKVSNRTVSHGQVRHLGLEFYSRDLLEYNGRKAVLYYDPTDIGMVAVYVDGAFITVAVNKEHTGEEERSWLALLKERARLDKEIARRLEEVRGGLTSEDAKAILCVGELSTAKAVSAAIHQKHTPQVVLMTGLETESQAVQQKIKKQKEARAEEKRRRELARKRPLRLVDVEKMR